MTKEDIIEVSKRLSHSTIPFELWASSYIKDALKEWEAYADDFFSDDFERVNDEVALNFDAKWLAECRDDDEMMSLLRSWYNKDQDEQ